MAKTRTTPYLPFCVSDARWLHGSHVTGSYLHQDSPVHGSCIRVRYRGEEQEEVGHNEEADGDNVDRNTPSSQTELRRWKFLSL